MLFSDPTHLSLHVKQNKHTQTWAVPQKNTEAWTVPLRYKVVTILLTYQIGKEIQVRSAIWVNSYFLKSVHIHLFLELTWYWSCRFLVK